MQQQRGKSWTGKGSEGQAVARALRAAGQEPWPSCQRAKAPRLLQEAGAGMGSYRNEESLGRGAARGNSRRKETQCLQLMLLINVITPVCILGM